MLSNVLKFKNFDEMPQDSVMQDSYNNIFPDLNPISNKNRFKY